MKLTPKTKWLGHEIFYFKSIDSTNNKAKQWVSENKNSPNGKVFIADHQSAGRGRYDRNWFSPEGTNLYTTLVLKIETDPKNLSQVTFPISLAILETCQKEVDHLKLKWPNDLMLRDKKVSGLLIENENDHMFVGIGININQETFPKPLQEIATSLYLEKKEPLNRDEVFMRLLEKTEKWYEYYLENGFEHVKELWTQKSDIVGRCAKLKNGEAVTLLGLESDGSLLYEKKNKEKGKVYSGDEICYWPLI